MSRNLSDLREVETSPDGRYVRFDEKLGNGSYKEVYLCYDTETGKEVAWNTVEMKRLPIAEKKRIRLETEILKELQHPHIINFYQVWENKDKEQICFTTEIVTSGTLKQYTNRVKGIKLKVIKKWCRQILAVLDYLHSHDPPIIHRDLKCDNIFINGSTGEIRVGDFGLSAHRTCTHAASVLGTPEFMAPELYEENYSESVDIYAFGMCVLEMVSKEFPYEECNNAAQIWKKVSGGLKPDVLNRIHDSDVRAFVEVCICKSELRLNAAELLAHPFLNFRKSDFYNEENKIVYVEPRPKEEDEETHDKKSISVANAAPQPAPSPTNHVASRANIRPSLINQQHPINNNNNIVNNNTSHHPSHPSVSKFPSASPPAPRVTLTQPFVGDASQQTGLTGVVVDVESWSGPHANISLHIHLDGGKRKKHIRFEMDFRHDTSVSVAGELMNELKLPEMMHDPERAQMLIASAMESKIDPVRKTYFREMAGEAHSESQVQTLPHHQLGNIHHSAIASSQQSPPTQFRQSSMDKIGTNNNTSSNHPPHNAHTHSQARPSVISPQSALPPLPTAHTSPTGPSRTIKPTIQTDAALTGAPSHPTHTPNSLSQPNIISPTNPTVPRPISNRSSLPPTSSPQGSLVSQHRYSSSLPSDGPSLIEMAAERHRQRQEEQKFNTTTTPLEMDFDPLSNSSLHSMSTAPHHPPSVVSSSNTTTPILKSLDTTDSPPPDDLEELDQSLVSEFKNLSVSVLKERIRSKPDGEELVKSCFEKHDLIQMLVKLTMKERKNSNASASGNTPTTIGGTSSISNTPQIPSMSAPAHKPNLSEPIDFFSSTSAPPATSSATQTLMLSPDPFAGLDVLSPSLVPPQEMELNPNLNQAADHRFVHNHADHHKPKSPQLSYNPPQQSAPVPSSQSLFDVASPLTDPSVAAFPFSPSGPFSNHSESAPSISASPRNNNNNPHHAPVAFDFHVKAASPSSRPSQPPSNEIDAGLQLFGNSPNHSETPLSSTSSFPHGILAGVEEEEARDEVEVSGHTTSHSLDIDVFAPVLESLPTRPPHSAGQKKHAYSTSIPYTHSKKPSNNTYRKNTTAADSDLYEFFNRTKNDSELIDPGSGLHLIPGLAAVQSHRERQKGSTPPGMVDLLTLNTASASPPAVNTSSNLTISSTKSEPPNVALESLFMDMPAASSSPTAQPVSSNNADVMTLDPFASLSSAPSIDVTLPPLSNNTAQTTMSNDDPFDPLALNGSIPSMRHKHTPSLDMAFPR